MPLYGAGGKSTLILGSSGTPASVSSGTAETQLGSVLVPANSMGLNGMLRIWTLWQYTNSANNKTFRIRFSGSAGTIYLGIVSTTTATYTNVTLIRNAGATNSQVGFANSAANPFTATSSVAGTSAIDTTADTTIYFSGQTANSGETITLLGYTVELIPGV